MPNPLPLKKNSKNLASCLNTTLSLVLFPLASLVPTPHRNAVLTVTGLADQVVARSARAGVAAVAVLAVVCAAAIVRVAFDDVCVHTERTARCRGFGSDLDSLGPYT